MTEERFPDPQFERQLADFLNEDRLTTAKRPVGNEDFVPVDGHEHEQSPEEASLLEDEYFYLELEACVDGVMLRQLLEERAEKAEETYTAREFDTLPLDELKAFLEAKKYNYREAVEFINNSAPTQEAVTEFRKIFDLQIFRSVDYLVWDERTDNIQAHLNYFSNPAIAAHVNEIYELHLGTEEQKPKNEAPPSFEMTETVMEKEVHELTDEEFLYYLMKKEHYASRYFHYNYVDIMHGEPQTGQPGLYPRNADLIDKANSDLKVEATDRAQKLRKAGNLLFSNASVDDLPLLQSAFDRDVYDQATFTLRPNEQRRSVQQRAEEAVGIIDSFASNDQAAALMREGLDDCIFSACQNEMKLKTESIEDLEEVVRTYASSEEVKEKMLRVLGLSL